MKVFRPLFLLTALLVVIGLACSLSGGGDTPAQPQPQQQQQQPQVEPTQPPPPTAPPAPTEEPTLEPTEAPPARSMYFTEEFDQDPNWDYFLTYGDKDNVEVVFKNGLMIFDLKETDTYAYYLYQDQEYRDVRIDIRAENRGRNNNNVSLVCRATDDGWYEFSTEGGGLWYLYAVTINDKKNAVYNIVDNGGANSLRQGKEVNEYAMICKGNEISLIVNDKLLKKIVESKYAFRDGQVGFNISSLNVTPIILEVDWFKVSEP